MNNSKSLYYIFIIIAAAVMYSCANIGNPSGGPIDKTPPIFMRSNPTPNAVNVKDRKIEIFFDEIVSLKDPSTKIIVSPAQTEMPRMSALGRKVTVELVDSLLPNTTYTIDFSNSIQDNNEGNAIDNFAFAFSTGSVIDSMRVSGYVLDSRTLEPMQSVVVGLQSNLADSAFHKEKLQRVALTNDRGQFTIRNVSPGSYHIFALKDLDRDYKFGNPTEDIAFLDSIIVPSIGSREAADTVYNDLNEIDTIMRATRPAYFPNDILLSMFNEDRKSQYLANNLRVDSTRISLTFAAASDTLPSLSIVGRNDVPDQWYTLERSQTNDTLIYWIRPPHLVSADTLMVATTYLRTDTASNLSWGTDTLKFTFQRQKAKKKKKNEETDSLEQIRFMELHPLANGTQEVYAPLLLQTGTPIERYSREAFHLQRKLQNDTTFYPAEIKSIALRDSTLSRRDLMLKVDWEPGAAYTLAVDSLAMTDIYGLQTKPLKVDFNVRKMEEYGNIVFNIPAVRDSAIVELLDGTDKVVLHTPVKNHRAELLNLQPGKYYARLFIDRNGNGKYDTGTYDMHLQPEETVYYPGAINLKKNWDVEQTWDIYATPIDKQKPEAIKKNKPERKKWEKVNTEKTETDEDEENGFSDFSNPNDPNLRNSNNFGNYRR
ncbi:MAG: Ig-like domain-containing protein [Prevotella sp.]|nr:Ig-like domain-containing protein [Prevotella sp.]MBS7207304.1 Ig-like domain-containing protein [Prevotella sp.]